MTKTKPGEDNATLYHVFPHNQHLFQLPECASQQVCNAVYLRLNFSTPLCACPQQGDPCSASTLDTDNHSLKLSADKGGKVGKYYQNKISINIQDNDYNQGEQSVNVWV